MIRSAAFWLSIVLACAGCAGLLLAGSGRRIGWAIGIAVQPVWIAFGIITGGYGLCLTAIMYAAVYTRNLLRWRAEPTPALDITHADITAHHPALTPDDLPIIIRGPRDAIDQVTLIRHGDPS